MPNSHKFLLLVILLLAMTFVKFLATTLISAFGWWIGFAIAGIGIWVAHLIDKSAMRRRSAPERQSDRTL